MIEEKYTDMPLTDEQASLLGFKSFSESEQYIQVKDVRYTLDEFNRIGDYLLGRNLSNDQQVVLEWLKEAYKRTKWSSPFGTVYSTINTHELFVRTRLTKAQQYQVLAAFAECGRKLEAEGNDTKI